MWLILSIGLGLLASGSWGKPTSRDNEVAMTCKDLFNQEGYKMDEFALAVAHGSHSLFLEDLRFYFEADAPEDNGIPILNHDISSTGDDAIWLNAPLAGYDDKLMSHGFKTMDFIFSHDSPNFLIKGLTTVEKLGHSFHMQMMWMRAKKVYQELKANPPQNIENFCSCANDVKANGILDMLMLIARINKSYGDEIPKELLAKARHQTIHHENEKVEEVPKQFNYGLDYEKEKQQKPKGLDYTLTDYKEKKMVEKAPKQFNYGLDYEKEKQQEPKQFNYGLDYEKEKQKQQEPKQFNYGLDYEKEKQKQQELKQFNYGLDYEKEKQQKPKAFDYTLTDYKEKKMVEKAPKQFNYGLDYEKEKQQEPKQFNYGLDYEKEKQKQQEPKQFNYGLDYEKEKQQKPKAFDYTLTDYKEKKMVEKAPKQFNYGLDYEKEKQQEPKQFNYGLDYEKQKQLEQNQMHKEEQMSSETDIFENWYPGTVTAAEGYQLLKTMLTKSMMNDKDLEAFARFIHCKLNY